LLTQRIIKNWREGKDGKEWKELWHSCRDEIRQMYIDAIEGERVFAKYLFQYGNPLKDVTEDLLNQSTEYYANKRMKNIGITKYSNLNKDPLPFAQSKYLTSKSVAGAPQEVTINQYLKNIVKKQDDMSVIARLFNT
jgi:ribonucleoside-diphosphate reductase beta chain